MYLPGGIKSWSSVLVGNSYQHEYHYLLRNTKCPEVIRSGSRTGKPNQAWEISMPSFL